jgi:hypothetical protein
LTSTVLLIGRHTGVLASVVERLTRRGHRVMLAWNSRDGARMAAAAKPDLIVLDHPDAQHRDGVNLGHLRNVVRLDGDRRPSRAVALVERALGA